MSKDQTVVMVEERTICSVLEDMRNSHKSRNYSYLKGLIEEAQSYANRMEDGLHSSRNTGRLLKNELEKDEPDLKVIKELVDKRWKFTRHSDEFY